MEKVIEIRPLMTEKWHGHKGETSLKRPVVIRALVGEDNLYTVDFRTANISEEDQQKLLESGFDLSLHHNSKVPHPLWDGNQAKVKLENNTQFVEIASPMGQIRKAILYGSKFVANTKLAYDEGKWPFATHYIVDSEAENASKASVVKMRNEATLKANKLSLERRKQIVFLLTGKFMKNSDEDTVVVELADLINERPEETLEYILRNSEQVVAENLIKEALYKAKITRTSEGIFFGDVRLGFGDSDAVDYIMDKKNQDVKLRIKELIS